MSDKVMKTMGEAIEVSTDMAVRYRTELERVTEENKKLRKALQNYVSAVNSGSIGRIGDCYKPAVDLLNQIAKNENAPT